MKTKKKPVFYHILRQTGEVIVIVIAIIEFILSLING